MSDLLLERDGPVATLLLNRPHARNALSDAMRDGLATAVARIEADPSIRAVVIAGAGGAFCAGGDVRALDAAARGAGAAGDAARRDAGPVAGADGAGGPEPDDEDPSRPLGRLRRMRRNHALVTALAQLDRPVIAAVDGPAFGAGFGLALLADLVVASDRARFAMAFQRVGLVPDFGAAYTLPRAVGLQRAKEIVYSARTIDAHEALRLGLVLEVQPVERLMPRVRALAAALAEASPTALGLAKRALNASLQSDLPTMLELEATGQAIAATGRYAADAFRAFAERRPARYAWPADDGDA